MARATMRLSEGNERDRRMARIIDELFEANWIQTFDRGGINVDVASHDRARLEQFVEQFNMTVAFDHGTHHREGRLVDDVSIKSVEA